MLEFRFTMDPHSREACRNGEPIGLLLWHEGRASRFTLIPPGNHLTIMEMKQVTAEFDRIVREREKQWREV